MDELHTCIRHVRTAAEVVAEMQRTPANTAVYGQLQKELREARHAEGTAGPDLEHLMSN